MATLNKTASGLLYYDDFHEQSLIWTLSPSNANNLAFGADGLQMRHNSRYVAYTIAEPSADEYSCIVHLDHKPVSHDDFAGILLMCTPQEYAECQSYMATGPSELVNGETFKVDIQNMVNDILQGTQSVRWYPEGTTADGSEPEISDEANRLPGGTITDPLTFIDVKYNWIKFIKMNRKYMFWASVDGYTWIEIGSVLFDSPCHIGFFIYGTDDENILKNSHCIFKSIAIYNGRHIALRGIDKTYDCEIIDANNRVVCRTDDIAHAYMISRAGKEILVNTLASPMPVVGGKLRIYPRRSYDNTLMTFDLGEYVYGGDVFSLERNIKLFIDNQEISTLDMYNLGDFCTGNYYIRVDVYNAEDYVLSDVKIKVLQYSEYYDGEEAIGIAKTPFGEQLPPPDLVYDKEVVFESIEPTQGRSFFMKLMDVPTQDFYAVAHSHRFKIIVE